MTQQLKDPIHFWDIRSEKYDKLFWVKDDMYIQEIIALGDLNDQQTVLDVGTGTGVVAQAIKAHTKHVVGIDISEAMLQKGDWTGISVINWNISDAMFVDSLFHRVFARMCFHHILVNLDRAILRCYDLLKEGGKIIIAEGVPPVDDEDVVEWYTEMFKHKEERITFTPKILIDHLERNGFSNVSFKEYFMEDFSIYNWVRNSGLDKEKQQAVIDMHLNASERIKSFYNMRITDDDCLVRTRNIIVVGEKR